MLHFCTHLCRLVCSYPNTPRCVRQPTAPCDGVHHELSGGCQSTEGYQILRGDAICSPPSVPLIARRSQPCNGCSASIFSAQERTMPLVLGLAHTTNSLVCADGQARTTNCNGTVVSVLPRAATPFPPAPTPSSRASPLSFQICDLWVGRNFKNAKSFVFSLLAQIRHPRFQRLLRGPLCKIGCEF